MNYKYPQGTWSAFTAFRSVGVACEQQIVIDAIAYPSQTGMANDQPAYVTSKGHKVPELDILEARLP